MKDVAIVMDLHELAPVGGRATSGRHRWRLEVAMLVRSNWLPTLLWTLRAVLAVWMLRVAG